MVHNNNPTRRCSVHLERGPCTSLHSFCVYSTGGPYNRKTHRFSPSSIAAAATFLMQLSLLNTPREPSTLVDILGFLFNWFLKELSY